MLAGALALTVADTAPATADDDGCGYVCANNESVELNLDLDGEDGSNDSGSDETDDSSGSVEDAVWNADGDNTDPGFLPGPVGPDAAPPDPAELAQHLVEQMPLAGPAINTTPPRGDEGAVGLPVWLWTDRGEGRWGTFSESLSAGGITVSASAEPRSITWDMGDGTVFTCEGPGTPYRESYGVKDSPTCGHRYEETSSGQPDGAYTITGTTHWAVTWLASTGQSGSFAIDIAESQPLEVGEIQVVVTQ